MRYLTLTRLSEAATRDAVLNVYVEDPSGNDAIINNKPAILLNLTTNEEYAINYDLSQRQKDIILAGGLLNYTKESF